jgi:hypothetical protein
VNIFSLNNFYVFDNILSRLKKKKNGFATSCKYHDRIIDFLMWRERKLILEDPKYFESCDESKAIEKDLHCSLIDYFEYSYSLCDKHGLRVHAPTSLRGW